jgi:hypothetical protein
MLNVFDVFGNEAFSVTRLAMAMREIRYTPARIGQLGLFVPESIDTLNFAIEKSVQGALKLVSSSPRGGAGQTRGGDERNMRFLRVPHFQRDDAFYADEVMAVRAFGSETAVETIASKIAMKAQRHAQDFALTEEYHRLSVIKNGTMLDADGSTLVDFFTEFGESQPAEIDFDLDNANPAEGALRKKCAGVTRAMANALDGLPFTGVLALMGTNFADDFYAHREIRDTYKGYADAATLRTGYVQNSGSTFSAYEFGGIAWEEYRGGGTVGIDPDKVHFVPLGVPDLFKTIYAPADYMETVNRPGQRMYAKQWEMPNGKGVNMEFQMNALHFCSRPRVLMRGRRT